MSEVEEHSELLVRLSRTFMPHEQMRLRELLKGRDSYVSDLLRTYLRSPFLRLTDMELAWASRLQPEELGGLVRAREAAARSTSRRLAVFCMPKSGSSFVASAVGHALKLPAASLTSFGTSGASSFFGMNSREQELDEMAVVKASLTLPDGFVAQHHTRFSPFLGLQMRYFNLKPLVTVRNIFDCIVSFDDMMLDWRGRAGTFMPWKTDGQFALPERYPELPEQTRYALLAHSFGVWLINFYLSWKRAAAIGAVQAPMLRYEDQVLDPERLVDTLSESLGLSREQRDRLDDYAHQPDRVRSRVNVGRRGRGAERISEETRSFLVSYANLFQPDLDEDDIAYLTG